MSLQQDNSKEERALKHIRKTYLLAKAVSIMYEAVKHDLTSEIRKAALEAKAKNNYFIKLVDESFKRKKVSQEFLEFEENLSFEVIDKLYEETIQESKL